MNNQNGAKLPGFPVLSWLIIQLFITMLLVGVIALLFSLSSAMLVGLGSIISTVPNALFAWYVYRFRGARNAQRILDSTYLGEGLKFLVTAVMFAGVFAVGESSIAPELFVGYLFAMVSGWIGSVYLQRR